MSGDPATRARENATAIALTIVTGLWLALLISGFGGSLWLAVMLIGYMVVVPLVALLYGDEEDRAEWWDGMWGDTDWDDWGEWWGENEREDRPAERELEPGRRDALETLRERYAAGELTDEQFEHKLERLLEVETVEDASEWARARSGDRENPHGDTDRHLERER
ncbi:SHOCT domain-containing protein [Saliphagus sp. LR7]|uniref:SHOCT domain-containing protein n=1 Tax=Saliphagus sp. LR7 TaxID=2282654 RepID=UPI000DF8234E|nr:SHOCT domain-containing protein [Saliphagus sp. LR7]